MEKEICPDHFKAAKIVPVYKSGDKAKATNYRPISLISNLAKIFEKILHTRLTNFFNTNNLISKNQYGFRNDMGTGHALVSVIEFLYNKLDKSAPVIATFLE